MRPSSSEYDDHRFLRTGFRDFRSHSGRSICSGLRGFLCCMRHPGKAKPPINGVFVGRRGEGCGCNIRHQHGRSRLERPAKHADGRFRRTWSRRCCSCHQLLSAVIRCYPLSSIVISGSGFCATSIAHFCLGAWVGTAARQIAGLDIAKGSLRVSSDGLAL